MVMFLFFCFRPEILFLGKFDTKTQNCQFFLNCYLAAPRPTLGHSQGDSLTNLMLITDF